MIILFVFLSRTPTKYLHFASYLVRIEYVCFYDIPASILFTGRKKLDIIRFTSNVSEFCYEVALTLHGASIFLHITLKQCLMWWAQTRKTGWMLFVEDEDTGACSSRPHLTHPRPGQRRKGCDPIPKKLFALGHFPPPRFSFVSSLPPTSTKLPSVVQNNAGEINSLDSVCEGCGVRENNPRTECSAKI